MKTYYLILLVAFAPLLLTAQKELENLNLTVLEQPTSLDAYNLDHQTFENAWLQADNDFSCYNCTKRKHWIDEAARINRIAAEVDRIFIGLATPKVIDGLNRQGKLLATATGTTWNDIEMQARTLPAPATTWNKLEKDDWEFEQIFEDVVVETDRRISWISSHLGPRGVQRTWEAFITSLDFSFPTGEDDCQSCWWVAPLSKNYTSLECREWIEANASSLPDTAWHWQLEGHYLEEGYFYQRGVELILAYMPIFLDQNPDLESKYRLQAERKIQELTLQLDRWENTVDQVSYAVWSQTKDLNDSWYFSWGELPDKVDSYWYLNPGDLALFAQMSPIYSAMTQVPLEDVFTWIGDQSDKDFYSHGSNESGQWLQIGDLKIVQISEGQWKITLNGQTMAIERADIYSGYHDIWRSCVGYPPIAEMLRDITTNRTISP